MVRFTASTGPSISIENEVMTSSTTAAWVRDSVSETSTRTSMRTPPGDAVHRN